MKKPGNYLLAFFLLAAGTATAQSERETASRWSVTPHVGANLWTAWYVINANYEVEKGDNRVGLTAGAELGYQLVPRVSVRWAWTTRCSSPHCPCNTGFSSLPAVSHTP